MRFLVDADLPRQTAALIRASGHEAIDVRDVGMGQAPDEEIASYARDGKFCILTGDFGFADIRNYPPADYFGIAVLEIPRIAVSETIMRMLRRFLSLAEVLAVLHGRLAIVTVSSVRLRPA